MQKYIQNPRTLRESFNGRIAESTKEGLELVAMLYTGNILTEVGLSVVNKLGAVGKQIAATAEKYPLLTDISMTAMANTGYQIIHENNYDVNSLIKSELSTVLTRGKTLGQQLSTNIILNTITTENPDDYGWNAFGAVTGTLGPKLLNNTKFGYKKSIYTPIYSNYIGEYLGEPKNIKDTFLKLEGTINEK